ncbi:MAG: arginine--tRNA ligase [Spirochaetes bacterium]|nr:arginine--tRNA ligase [Spirochaetota bacterium]
MTIKAKFIDKILNDIILSLKKLGADETSPVYEIPPSKEMGDIAFPMFKYAKTLKQNPALIAEKVKEGLKGNELMDKIEIKGPYLNIFFNKNLIAYDLLKDILDKKDDFGRQPDKKIKVAIEFSSPNTNKPLHLGHCRNNALGDSIAKILIFNGYETVKINLINDRGIHICKSMIAYKKFGNNTTPEKEGKKSDHLVGDFYVKYAQEEKNNPEIEKEALELLNLWEQNDRETHELWVKMNKWALDGIKETYKRMGIEFDQLEYESDNYLLGKDLINEGLNKNIFYKEEDGSIWVNNEDAGLDKKVLLRSDGTSVYITQDIGTAAKRHDKYNFNRMIYIVGSEQIYHFKTLFTILKKMGFDWADKCIHLSYGMVNLPSGKMKSREGTVVDADNLMDLLYDMSMEVLNEKGRDLTEQEKKETAVKISLSALKYYLLNFSTVKDVMFIPEKSISFDGNTGPYLQYTTARLNSLFNKSEDAGVLNNQSVFNHKFNEDEANLVISLLEFEDAVIKAGETLSPLEICSYLYDLARTFNKFYHDNPVIRAETKEIKNIRLLLSKASLIILMNGLKLLGIDDLKKM